MLHHRHRLAEKKDEPTEMSRLSMPSKYGWNSIGSRSRLSLRYELGEECVAGEREGLLAD